MSIFVILLCILGVIILILTGMLLIFKLQINALKRQLNENKGKLIALKKEMDYVQTAKEIINSNTKLLMLLMISCTSKGITVISGCSSFGFIYPSRNDTLQTKRQVLNHNEIYKYMCEGQKEVQE